MKSGVKIPEHLLDRFKNQSVNPEQPGGEGSDPGGGEDASGRELEVLESMNDTLSWICKTGDDMAKKRGYPGLGDLPPEQLGDLFTIIAKRNFPKAYLDKSPEAAGVAVVGGIIISNYLAHTEKMKKAAKAADQKTESGEND